MTGLPQSEFLGEISEELVELTDETARWRAREAAFVTGPWTALSKRIPNFVVEEFRAYDEGPANPHLRAVVRLPLSVTEQTIPVGIVSKTYRLVQHAEVVEACLKALKAHGVDTAKLRCDLGLTELGEWMHFRVYFPESYSYGAKDQHKLTLRLECMNSVDGSSRLIVQLSWFRLVCRNGLTVKETTAVLRDIHNQHLDLSGIPEVIAKALTKVHADKERLGLWEESPVHSFRFEDWIDGTLAGQWGKKAACRALHICRGGADVELLDLFEGGKASQKTVRQLATVPGAPQHANNLYDVCQALSWLATQRKSADERLEWQGQIPTLVENLRSTLVNQLSG